VSQRSEDKPHVIEKSAGGGQNPSSSRLFSANYRVLKKLQIAALAFGSPLTGSIVDPNHVWWPPTTVSSWTVVPALQSFHTDVFVMPL
jgi:hypothetical protein